MNSDNPRELAEQIADEQIDSYAENLTPAEEMEFRQNAAQWRDLIADAALAALTEKESAR